MLALADPLDRCCRLCSGSLGVTHGMHTCCGSLDKRRQLSGRVHGSPTSVFFIPVLPACFLFFFSAPLSCSRFTSAVHSWFTAGFFTVYCFLLVFIGAQHQIKPEIFNVRLKNVGEAEMCTPKFTFWLLSCVFEAQCSSNAVSVLSAVTTVHMANTWNNY